MPQLNFHVPLAEIGGMDAFNAFAAVHTYLSAATNENLDEFQERTFFILNTLSGCASWLADYEGKEPNPRHQYDEVLDFCMGFCGYTYKRITKDFDSALAVSIEAGMPVLAELKDHENGSFRILIGLENNMPVVAIPTNQQDVPSVLTFAEIAQLYIITGKTVPTKYFSDGLRNIIVSLEKAAAVGAWENAQDKFDFYMDTCGGINRLSLEEIRTRFDRIRHIAWNFDHCHNVNSAFGNMDYLQMPEKHPITEEQAIRLRECAEPIGSLYYWSSHEIQWLLIGLYDCRHWNKKEWYSKEAGLCTCVRWAMEKLADNDRHVLAIIKKMLTIVEPQ